MDITPFVIAGLIFAIPLLWWILVANQLIRAQKGVETSWADVDIVLKRRHDLIPQLLASVKSYANYEGELVQKVAQAREKVLLEGIEFAARVQNENDLTHDLSGLMAKVEAYPDLKTSAQFVELQRELSNTEDRIAAARRFYNANVRTYNTLISTFPGSVIASSKYYIPAPYFAVDERVREFTPQV